MRRIAWLIVPVILVGLLAMTAFATRAPSATTAFTLKAGNCFDIPADTQVGDIPLLDCTQPHDAEVFVALGYADTAPSTPVQYPGASAFGEWAGNNCGLAAEQAYAGAGGDQQARLVVGYFFPDADAWSRGERQVTCYLHAAAGSKLRTPVRGAGASDGGANPSPS